ncbi:hypothetical protein MMC08_006257 [Hypocenomyce scalaris]|nr:hypothetical protein [Hypocenomyce scalaris]
MGNRHSTHSSTAPVCPDDGSTERGVPIAGSLTFQQILLIAGGACTAITLALSLSNIIKHLHRYTVPAEQRQIVRMVFTPVVFAVFNLLAIAFYSASIYLSPIADLYEAFSLASVYLLVVHYVAPDDSQHERFFSAAENVGPKGQVTLGGSFQWFKRTWIVVFLYPVIRTILFVAQEASQATGTFCYTSNNVHFGHVWITALGAIFVTVAVLAILRFYRRFKRSMTGHRTFSKLINFKLIVFTSVVQTLVFTFLNSGGHLHGNSKVTHNDLWLGIPALLVCAEQVIFSAFFHYSCGSREYHASRQGNNHRGMGLLGAAADAMNPSDLLNGIATVFYLLLGGGGGGGGGWR